jgi:predicted ArsR family transcriptional regulator
MTRPVTVTDDELVSVVETHQPAATNEVADAVGLTRQGVHKRLRQLVDDGRLDKQMIGNSLAWSVAND